MRRTKKGFDLREYSGPWQIVATVASIVIEDKAGRLVCEIPLPEKKTAQHRAIGYAEMIAKLPEVLAELEYLAETVAMSDDCDHKRQSCEDVGCIMQHVRRAQDLLARIKSRPQ